MIESETSVITSEIFEEIFIFSIEFESSIFFENSSESYLLY